MRNAGTVVTFYSYKGGVGRSFALANVAAVLANWGFRVLCVDWDLDAPGLSHYFRPWLGSDEAGGLVEMVQGATQKKGSRAARLGWRELVSAVNISSNSSAAEPTLHLLPAGVQNDSYARRVQEIDWAKLYGTRHDLGGLLEDIRDEWKRDYDFIFIDSRTGITDIGGICTAQMPDVLVFCFTANHQSLDGAVDIARRAAAARNRLPYDRARLLQVPLVCRFDIGEEYKRAEEWRKRFYEVLDPFYGAWTPKEVPAQSLVDHSIIPYFSYWSFGEEIPVLVEDTRTPGLISYSFETVAALLAHRLAKTELLVQSRDSFVDAARRLANVQGGFRYDLFFSYDGKNRKTARELADSLERRGVKVFFDESLSSGEEWSESTGRALSDSQHMVTLLGEKPSRGQREELNLFMRQSLDDDGSLSIGSERTVLPVLVEGATVEQLPSLLRHSQYLTLDTNSPAEEAAAKIFEAMDFKLKEQA